MLAQPTQVALLVAPFTLFAGWSLMQAWRTGKISSRGWNFGAKKNPIGFWLVVVCHFLIFSFGVALALQAMGLIDYPIRIQLPL